MKGRAVMAILLAIAVGVVTSVAVAETGGQGKEAWCAIYPDQKCWSDCNGNEGNSCYSPNQRNVDPPN